MITAIWIAIGYVGTLLVGALGSRFISVHTFPDVAIVVVTFVALRRPPVASVVTGIILGYFCGRMSLAPVGLLETSLGMVAVGIFAASGRLAGEGRVFFASVCAVAVSAHHLLCALLLGLRGWHAGFASWASATLIPAAALTALVALLMYPLLDRLHQSLEPTAHEGLGWL